MRVELAIRGDDVLGEGPIWDERAGALHWVDIRRCLIKRLDVVSGEYRAIGLAAQATALGIRRDPGLLAAVAHGVGVLDIATGAFEPRISFEQDLPRNRSNDGGVATDGRFWFGTMDDSGEAGRGALYALSPDWSLERVLGGLSIPNGIVAAADGRALYVADSGEQVIRRYPLDPDSGALAPPSEFVSLRGEAHTPDGAALDEEGCLWSAHWDGARVVRYTPEGNIDHVVEIPAPRPTSCAFGGSRMTTLYITSARDGLSQTALSEAPLSGSVFCVDVGVRGLELPLFKG